MTVRRPAPRRSWSSVTGPLEPSVRVKSVRRARSRRRLRPMLHEALSSLRGGGRGGNTRSGCAAQAAQGGELEGSSVGGWTVEARSPVLRAGDPGAATRKAAAAAEWENGGEREGGGLGGRDVRGGQHHRNRRCSRIPTIGTWWEGAGAPPRVPDARSPSPKPRAPARRWTQDCRLRVRLSIAEPRATETGAWGLGRGSAATGAKGSPAVAVAQRNAVLVDRLSLSREAVSARCPTDSQRARDSLRRKGRGRHRGRRRQAPPHAADGTQERRS